MGAPWSTRRKVVVGLSVAAAAVVVALGVMIVMALSIKDLDTMSDSDELEDVSAPLGTVSCLEYLSTASDRYFGDSFASTCSASTSRVRSS
jgi:hypothetical protein